ncbi:iron-containing alcohol dehydrogenase [Stratiformator vulcanicus]|uniref:Alcohol dehydrogenase 2 n=1 Tax=Stratiformator vulcanicus TaxID=2527980 RepID=A0A517R0U5_9PLAN|nr:iron-containing alcohol dehydrogenase [Stratiformator vulcanicus]QDT37454.1 Alcohol dehydrogenase 2 [Stratiformator vulcanicus]
MTQPAAAKDDSHHDERFAPGDGFDWQPRTRVIFGKGRLDRLGSLVREYGGTKVLVCSDPGVRDAGHTARGKSSLEAAGIDAVIFDEINPNPTTEDVDRGLAVAKRHAVDFIVGLGGGSAMDCAKGVNFLFSNGGRMQDYWGVGKAQDPMLPMIAVPTTAGTGSEAQSFALIADAKTHQKMACGDRKAACVAAILDPELTVSMPRSVTVATGLDAIAHAMETYVTKPRNGMSSLFARRAWELLATHFLRVVQNPDDVDARGAMLLGAHFAGAAIESSMLGATHALANPITAHYGTTHGVIIGLMLPHVVRFNWETAGHLYQELGTDTGLLEDHNTEPLSAMTEFLTSLLRHAGLPTNLGTLGVEESMIPTLAAEAAEQWTGKFNPRPVDAKSLEEVYRWAY